MKAGSSRLLLFLAGYKRWGMDAERRRGAGKAKESKIGRGGRDGVYVVGWLGRATAKIEPREVTEDSLLQTVAYISNGFPQDFPLHFSIFQSRDHETMSNVAVWRARVTLVSNDKQPRRKGSHTGPNFLLKFYEFPGRPLFLAV